MERFTDRKQLFGGCSIVLIERGEVTYHEYIMPHPKSRRYILALARCKRFKAFGHERKKLLRRICGLEIYKRDHSGAIKRTTSRG